MKLELKLVRKDGLDASVGACLASSYVEGINNPTDEVLIFLKDNTQYFEVIPELVDNIKSATKLTPIDIQCIRYILNINNVDLIIRAVAVEQSLAEGETEVLLTNYNQVVDGWVPVALSVKYPDEELDVEEIFRLIDSNFKLFDGQAFEGMIDPFIEQVDNIAPAEVMMDGQVPRSLVDYCTSIIGFIGIEIFRIVPNV